MSLFSQNAINEGLTPFTESQSNLSRATLSCSVKSKNQAHISWSHVVRVLIPVCMCLRT